MIIQEEELAKSEDSFDNFFGPPEPVAPISPPFGKNLVNNI